MLSTYLTTRTPEVLTYFLRFILIGILNTSINYWVYFILFYKCHIYFMLAGVIGFLSGGISGFIMNKTWTFKSEASIMNEGLKYFLVQCFCLVLHLSIQY